MAPDLCPMSESSCSLRVHMALASLHLHRLFRTSRDMAADSQYKSRQKLRFLASVKTSIIEKRGEMKNAVTLQQVSTAEGNGIGSAKNPGKPQK